MKRSIVFVLTALVIVSVGSPAIADADKTIRVVVSGTDQAKFADSAKTAFASIGWTATVESAPSKALLECIRMRKDGAGCLGRSLGDVAYVASFTIGTDEAAGTAVVTASLLRVSDGESMVIPVRRFCECSVEQTAILAEVVKTVSEELVSEIQAEDSPSFVDIQCEPSDAVLTMDGIRTGMGKRRVKPGKLTVVATREGYESKSFEVDVAAGEVVSLPIDLQLVSRSNLTLLAVGLGVAGGLTIAAGFFLIDEKKSVDGDQRLPEGSRVNKVATISLGVGLLAAAGVSLFFARRQNEKNLEASRKIALVPAPDGLSIAFLGRF